MSRKVKFSLSLSSLLLRVSIIAIFLLGLLPIPALAAGNGTFAGQVTDNATGNPIAGATIGILESVDAPPSWEVNTGGDGNYSVSVPEGTGYAVGAVSHGYVSEVVTGQSITANVTTPINFSLVPGGIIGGTVTDNYSGNSIQGADVWAYKPGTPEVRYETMPTSANGSYSLAAPQGTGYTVQVAKQGYVDVIHTGIDAELGVPKLVNLALEPLNPPPASVTDLATGNVTHASVILTWTAPGANR
ncbi:MAG: carboxypeptidase regulatory-like domain-containing protein, partial [Dehalococcoidales bacterium]|nr:carboxypeptidase regulatory-like domain-containing protein [Dehalococcoidales bacterium]